MRIRDFIRRTALPVAACLGLAASADGAVTFTNTPAVAPVTYDGAITLLISGVTNGEPVVMRKYLDVNTNGVIDAADMLVQRFSLTDGGAMVFGAITTITPAVTNISGGVTNVTPAVTNYSAGFTNIDVPGDFGSVTGQITTMIDFQNQDVAQKLAGQRYLYRLSSPSARFTSVTNAFALTNAAFTQGFSGHVTSNATNIPRAFVLLFNRAADGRLTPQAGTLSDNAGAYQINAAPGTYLLLAAKSNFVADTTTAPYLTLASNEILNADLSLIAATQSISGRLIESAYSGYLLTGFTYGIRANGTQYASTNLSYTYTIFSANCAYFQNVIATVNVSAPIMQTILVSIKGKTWYAAPTTYVDGKYQTTLTRTAANDQECVGQGYSVFAGDVMEDQTSSVGVPGTLLFAQSTNGLLAMTFSDDNSNFVARVVAGRWVVSPDAAALQVHGDLRQWDYATNNTATGSVSGVTITVPKANAIIHGIVAGISNQPLSGILMYGSDTNRQYELTGLRTATNGSYIAGALAGTWRLRVSTNNPGIAGYVVVPTYLQTNLIAGQAIQQNFMVQAGTNMASNFSFTAPQQFSFDFTGNIGASYAAQYATNLAMPVWTTFLTFQLATNPFTITDSNAASSPRFYRIQLQ